MGLAYANPPFSLLAKVLTKIHYEGGRVVTCTPDRGCSGEHTYWRRLLDRMTVGRVQRSDGHIYVPEDSDTAMQAPEWASFLSIVDGSLNPVPLCDFEQVLLKKVMAEIRGLTISDPKKDLLSTYLPHLQGVNPLMAIWSLQLWRRNLTTNSLKSPALSLLLIPAVLNSNTVPSWPSCCWRR